MKSAMHWYETAHILGSTVNLEESPAAPNRFSWRDAWQHLLSVLSLSTEPHVWHSVDATGTLTWHGYDPQTGHAIHDVGEAELRSWLEKRYYQ